MSFLFLRIPLADKYSLPPSLLFPESRIGLESNRGWAYLHGTSATMFRGMTPNLVSEIWTVNASAALRNEVQDLQMSPLDLISGMLL